MEKLFGNYFLGKSHFSYIKNVFGINFAIISGWSVELPRVAPRMTVLLQDLFLWGVVPISGLVVGDSWRP